jgi:DNA-binding transcriptional MerR regulator
VAAVLTVGDFSRATHLSVKTLRHYHQVGLLEPTAVNPDTGYRYYSAEQIPTAQVIRRLRDLEMPVANVKAVLAAPDAPARNALIAAHLNRLEAELAQTRTAVESLRNLLQPADGPAAIEHRSVPATAAAAIGTVVDRADLLAWWQGALGELRATVRAQGLHAIGPSGGVFASELLQQDRGQATVFIPVEGRVRPIGRVTSPGDPGGRTRHHQPSRLSRRRGPQLRQARLVRRHARDQHRRAVARVLPARRRGHARRGGMEDRNWLAHLPRRRHPCLAHGCPRVTRWHS